MGMAILLILMLVLSAHVVCMTYRCSIFHPYPPYHKYYHPGDLMVGGISTQVGPVSEKVTFQVHPPPVLPGQFL